MQTYDTYLHQSLDHKIVEDRQYTLTFDAKTFDIGVKLIPSLFYIDENNNHIELISETIALTPTAV